MTVEEKVQNRELSEELVAAIRKEIIQKTATYTVVGIVGFIIIAGTGWMLYLKDRLPVWASGVPRGTIIAVDLGGRCPENWEPFRDAQGRFIIGAGEGKNLTERAMREVGGRESFKLTIDQLPSQQISISGLAAISGGDRYDAGGRDYPAIVLQPGSIQVGGQGNEIPALPPYLALTYCKLS